MNYLYQITNLLNNKIYVGVHRTEDINDGYMGSGTAIKRAIKKYGIENFKKNILESFDTYEAALLAEKKIVNSDFLKRKDVYNLRTGGIGGWEHIQHGPIEKRVNIVALRKKIASGEIKVGGSDNWTKDGRAKIIATAKANQAAASKNAQTPNAIKKRGATFTEIKHQQGSNNSQYGRRWISSIITKEIKRISSGTEIPEGWVKGKTGKVIKTCWINDGIREYIIPVLEQDSYLEKGYIIGRFHNNMPSRL